MNEREQLEKAIAIQEGLRNTLPDDVVEATIMALREKLTALTSASHPKQQRKQVSILFADVSGFTVMSEEMDAEEVNEIMNALWQRLDRVVVEHNGYIDKHIGDAIMALWGTDISREDDAKQAVLAALAMQSETHDFANSIHTSLKMRIGINTGSVLMGEVGTLGEFTAIGDAVNIASRLEHIAPVGKILISHDTYRHVRGIFDVEKQPPTHVKGKEEPLQLYIVKRAKPRAFRMGRRGIEGIETRMVGRTAEMQQLQNIYQKVFTDAQLHIVTIVGEAGIGKSRLLDEFTYWLELRPEIIRLFKGRMRLEEQHIPYALLRDIFAFRFQIQDTDSLDIVWQKMEQGLNINVNNYNELDISMRARIITQWLGFDFSASSHVSVEDAQELHDRALMYLVDFWQALAAQGPIVIFLDDIHWADDSSLNILTDLAQRLKDYSILFVILARPSLFVRQPNWGKNIAFQARIDLSPLSQRESHHLVEEVLQHVENIPVVLRELVVSHAEGNPFYIEELIKMMVDDGIIIKDQPKWQVESIRLANLQVPTTLTSVLQARLDRLSSSERITLQVASVIGRVFWDQVITFLNKNDIDSIQLSDSLSILHQREMILPRQASLFVQTQEYIFKHAVLHQVTYESVLLRLRRQYHAQVAEWLIQNNHDYSDEMQGVIANHLIKAEKTKEAIPFLEQAGNRAAARYANMEAITYFTKALNLLPPINRQTRYKLLLAREKIYHLRGEREAQQQDLKSLDELANQLTASTNFEYRTEVSLRLADYALATGDYTAAIAATTQALHIAQMANSEHDEIASYLTWGQILLRKGEYIEADEKLKISLSQARSRHLPQLEADSLRFLGVKAADLGQFEEAKAHYTKALSLYQLLNDKRGESIVWNNISVADYSQSKLEEALINWEKAYQIHLEIGDREGQSRVLSNLSTVYLDLGDYNTAYTYSQEALRICQEIDLSFGQCFNLINLSLVSYFLCDEESARHYSHAACSLAEKIDSLHLLGMALKDHGFLLTQWKELDEAKGAYLQALKIWEELSQSPFILEAQSGLAHIALLQDNIVQAQRCITLVIDHIKTGNSLEGTTRPFDIYLTCYQILQYKGDPYATILLEHAYSTLQERASKMSEDIKQLYLNNVAENKQIIALWQATKKRGA